MSDTNKEIDLKDLLRYILVHWKSIIVVALIFGIVCTGYSFYSMNKSEEPIETKEITIDNMCDSTWVCENYNLSEDEYDEVVVFNSLNQSISAYTEFYNSYNYMNICPYKAKSFMVQFYLDPLNGDNSVAIRDSDNSQELVAENITTQTVVAMLDSKLHSDESYELMASSSGIEIDQSEFSGLIFVDSTGNLLSVQVVCVDGMDMNAMIEQMKALVLSYKDDIMSQNVVSFELSYLSSYTETGMVESILERQNSLNEKISLMKDESSNIENSLSDAQKQYVDDYQSINQNKEPIALNDTSDVKTINKKKIVIFTLLGLFLMAAFWGVNYVFSSKLQNEKELVDEGVKLLGVLSKTDKKKRSYEEQLETAIGIIQVDAKMQSINKIVLTGSEIDESDRNIVDTIVERLNKSGIQVVVLENLYYNAKALEEAVEIENVVFLERVGASVKNDICNVVTMAKEHHINVMGAIVLK